MRERPLGGPRLLPLLFAAALAPPRLGAAVALRSRTVPKTEAAAPPKGRRRACRGGSGGFLGLVAGRQAARRAQEVGVFADGYSRIACEVDAAPEELRIHFQDRACGEVSSCRLLELPMAPRLCFDFCRQFPTAKFFGIVHGRDCYCSPYFQAKSSGGQGTCSFACEGRAEEACGGPEKSSLFEMHLCGDSASEADLVLQLSREAEAAVSAVARVKNATAAALRELAGEWRLGVCSIVPEGERVCAAPKVWLAAAADASDGGAAAEHAGDIVAAQGAEVEALQGSAEAAGEALNASLASHLELATDALRTASTAALGDTAAANATLRRLAGPLLEVLWDGGVEAFGKAFEPLGNVTGGWYAVCALTPIAGEAYAAMAADHPAACADRCLSLSSGTSSCVAFNYQYREGLASCQLLSAGGLVQPMLAKAVPIFEVSKSKRDAMGLASLGCYAHGAFLAGHPRGPLGTHVVRSVVVENTSGDA